MAILSFGEILWDIYPDQKYIGGAPLNFAAHLAKHGEKVYMLSSLGEDELGKEAICQIKKWNICDKYISLLDNKQTGRCLVTLNEDLVPSYNLLSDVAYDYITCDALTDDIDVLYFGTMALRSKYNGRTLKNLIKQNRFKEVYVDVNIRWPFFSKEVLSYVVENATILKISLEELPAVADLLEIGGSENYKEISRLLAQKQRNLKFVIITLGGEGAYVFDAVNNKDYFDECKDVQVVSTVGAGDSFSAAFLYKYSHFSAIQDCLEYANKVASLVVSKYDAVPDYSAKDLV